MGLIKHKLAYFFFLFLSAFFNIHQTANAADSPHVDLYVTYEEKAGKVVVHATTFLTTSAPKFVLSNVVTLTNVEIGNNAVIYEASDSYLIALKEGQNSAPIVLTYSILLPASKKTDRSTDHNGGADWSGDQNGAFIPGNRIWYPLFQEPSTAKITIKTRSHLHAVAPGHETGSEDTNGYRVSTFEMPQPILGIDLMIGQWLVSEKQFQGITGRIILRTYFDENNNPLSEEYLALSERYIKYYEELIGPYPYTSFAVVSSPFPTGLGMPSLTYISEKILKYPFIKNRSLPHEIVHNWLGNGIRASYESGNWSEGLTTYLADYWQTELKSQSAAKDMRYGWLRNYASVAREDEQSLSSFSSRHHTASSAIGYGKGAMFFHMLRTVLGKPAFISCIKDFWGSFQFKSASYSTIRDTCQKYTTADLNLFFEAWVPTLGAPTISVVKTPRMSDNRQLLLTQDGSWVYNLEIEYASLKNESEIITIPLENKLTEVNILENSKGVAQVQIDPNFNVWRNLYSEEIVPTIRDFIVAKEPIYKQLGSNVINGQKLISEYFLENEIQKKPHKASDLSERLESIHLGDISEVRDHLLLSTQANDQRFLTAMSNADFLIASLSHMRGKTLFIGVSPKIDEEMLFMLLSRARHYGKYSWLTISSSGQTFSGKWSRGKKLFELSASGRKN